MALNPTKAPLMAALSVVLLTLGGCTDPKKAGPPPQALPTVDWEKPTSGEFTEYEYFTGRLESRYSINIRARVTGYLDKALFQEGDEVEEKDVLFEIDPRSYQAEFNRAEAALQQAEAHLKRCEADERRASSLIAKHAISQEDFDKYTGDYLEAAAAVGTSRAIRDNAKLNLGWTKVIAPVSGVISYRMVDPGNLVKADDTILTSIITQDPLLVYFDVDERTMLRVRSMVTEGKIKSYREHALMVDIGLANDAPPNEFPIKGQVDFLDNHVDTNTGTIRSARSSRTHGSPRP